MSRTKKTVPVESCGSCPPFSAPHISSIYTRQPGSRRTTCIGFAESSCRVSSLSERHPCVSVYRRPSEIRLRADTAATLNRMGANGGGRHGTTRNKVNQLKSDRVQAFPQPHSSSVRGAVRNLRSSRSCSGPFRLGKDSHLTYTKFGCDSCGDHSFRLKGSMQDSLEQASGRSRR